MYIYICIYIHIYNIYIFPSSCPIQIHRHTHDLNHALCLRQRRLGADAVQARGW